MIYLQLFWSFFQIGLFSIGGGYAAMPLIQNQVVDLHHWPVSYTHLDVYKRQPFSVSYTLWTRLRLFRMHKTCSCSRRYDINCPSEIRPD